MMTYYLLHPRRCVCFINFGLFKLCFTREGTQGSPLVTSFKNVFFIFFKATLYIFTSCLNTYVCKYECMYICMYVCIVCVCARAYAHTHTYTHVHKRTHKRTHTHQGKARAFDRAHQQQGDRDHNGYRNRQSAQTPKMGPYGSVLRT